MELIVSILCLNYPGAKITTTTNDGIPPNKHKKVLPLFNGDGSNIALYNSFKVKFKQYLDYYKISQSQIHSVLSDALTGDAPFWFVGYTEEVPEVNGMGYKELMEILDDEYLNPLAQGKYEYDYEQLKPDYNESIEDLSKRIQKAAIRAGIKQRTNRAKKHKLFGLLADWLQSQVNTLNDDKVSYEQFKTNFHFREIEINKNNKYKRNWRLYQFGQYVYGLPDNNNRQTIITIITIIVTIIVDNVQNAGNNGNKWNSNGKPSCDYCKKPNHSTTQCSNLLKDYINKSPLAIKFWTDNKMDEKINRNNQTNNDNTNSKTNNAEPKKEVQHKTLNINYCANKPLVYLNGRLNNYPVENILIDEGSSLSLISLEFYNELEKQLGRSLNSTLSINSLPRLLQADGITPLTVKGKIELELKFNNIKIGKFWFVIIKDTSHSVLVGRDITSAANLTIVNDNGTKVIQGTDTANPNILLGESVNVFEVNNIADLSSKKILHSINQILRDSITTIAETTDENKTGSEDGEIELPQHLREVQIGSEIHILDRQRIQSLILEFEDVFYKPGDPIVPLNTDIRHTIRLVENTKPIQSKIYRLPYSHNKVISEQITKWLDMGILEPSYSPWSTPCIVVDKKDQQLGRVCGDFRKLNDLTVSDAYPIRQIEEQKAHFNGSNVFSAIDLKDAYLQVELDEASKELTAIVTTDGLFEFNRMIQGLKTAPATFHRIIDSAFKEVIDTFLKPYFDDLTIHSATIDLHIQHLRQTFEIMRKFRFRAKPSKCKFGVEEIQWLGFVISNGKIKPDKKLVDSIAQLKIPVNVSEIRMVTGLFNFYRNFIPNFANRCEPLDRLKKTETKFVWGTDQQIAFDDLRNSLMSYPVLRLPNVNKPFILDTDASTIGIGGILQQLDEDSGNRYVVSYYSRRLSIAERKWGITDLEALALRDSISKFSRYLIGSIFTVYVDHISLTYLNNLKTLTGKLGRIALDLMGYDFTVVYKPGKHHINVDVLSRMPIDSEADKQSDNFTKSGTNSVTENESTDDIAANIVVDTKADLKSFKLIQEADVFTMTIIKYLTDKEGKLHDDYTDYLNVKNQKWEVQDGMLKTYDPRVKPYRYRIVIPDANKFMQLQLTQLLHNNNHTGLAKMYTLLREKFYWSEMKKYVSDFIGSCIHCQKTKRNYNNSKIAKTTIVNQTNENTDSVVEPFSQITVDYLDLPITETGYRCLLVIIDRATRLVQAIPCKSHDAHELVKNLINHWIFNYGVPRIILSDNGGAFVSILMKQLIKVLAIDQMLSTPYNPQSHGLVERANQTIGKVLRGILHSHQDGIENWENYIHHTIFVINTTVNTTTGFTPYELVYGRKASYPIDRLLYDDEVFSSTNAYFQDLLKKQKVNYAIVHEKLLTAKEKNEIYNSENKSKLRVYDVGNLVYKAKSVRLNKLDIIYDGPYEIMKKINNLCYQIRLCDSEKAPLILVNVRQLKPFIDEDVEISTAVKTRQMIQDLAKEDQSVTRARRRVVQDDDNYLDDAHLDWLLNGHISTKIP